MDNLIKNDDNFDDCDYKFEDLSTVEDPSILYNLMNNSPDSSSFMTRLTRIQKMSLQEYIERKQVRKNEELFNEAKEILQETFPSRKVTKLVNVRVCDYSPQGKSSNCNSLLTLWGMDESITSAIQEGRRFKIYSLSASFSKESGDNSSRASLRAYNGAIFKQFPIDPTRDIAYKARKFMTCLEARSVDSCAEIDIAVVIVGNSILTSACEKLKSGDHLLLCLDETMKLVIIQIKDSISLSSAFKEHQVLLFRNLLFVYFNRQVKAPKYNADLTCEVNINGKNDKERDRIQALRHWVLDANLKHLMIFYRFTLASLTNNGFKEEYGYVTIDDKFEFGWNGAFDDSVKMRRICMSNDVYEELSFMGLDSSLNEVCVLLEQKGGSLWIKALRKFDKNERIAEMLMH